MPALQSMSSSISSFPAMKTLVTLPYSAPSQIVSALMLAAGVALLVWGYKLLRPVNFVTGAYLGGTISLLVLNIFTPALSNCPLIVACVCVAALFVGIVCACKRASMLVVLGITVGEIAGDLFFKTFLAALAPDYVAFGCIGFFAVLCGVFFGHAGDLAWKVGCAFLGGFLIVRNIIKLVRANQRRHVWLRLRSASMLLTTPCSRGLLCRWLLMICPIVANFRRSSKSYLVSPRS